MNISRILPFVLLVSLVFSCKPKVPGKYIQPKELEDILYDYHLADAMAKAKDDAETAKYDAALYRQAVLNKHGVTQAELDSSLVYYLRHADRMHSIYENLTRRFEDDAMALGASATDIRRYGDMSSARDTSNLWRGLPVAMLMPTAPYNVVQFEIIADSTYQKGDKIIFSFNSSFIFRNNGSRDGTAMLAVEFSNDSVTNSTTRISSNTSYSLTIADNKRKGIKAIRGFFYLSDKRTSESGDNDLRLMFIDNIRMVRMRSTEKEETEDDKPAQPLKATADTAKNVKPQTGSPAKGNALLPAPPSPSAVRPLKMSEVQPVKATRTEAEKK